MPNRRTATRQSIALEEIIPATSSPFESNALTVDADVCRYITLTSFAGRSIYRLKNIFIHAFFIARI
jgi:hypothetical protein